jgi:DNA-binding MarR family transcriptional regulator
MLQAMEKAAILPETTTLEQARTFVSRLIELSRQVLMPRDDQVSELPLAQLRVCGTLFHGPRPMSALSRELGVSQSAMTQIADRLERARLVQRVAEGSDRRVKCLQLTPRGERIMRNRDDVRIQRVLGVLEQLPPKARREILKSLETFAGACSTVKQPPRGNGEE